MEVEPSPTPGSGTCDKPQSRHDTVVPDTISSPTGTTTCSSRDEPRSADFEVEPHTSSSPSPRLSSLTSAGSNGQQHESSVPVKGQCHSQTLKSSPAVKSENGPTTSRELTLYASEPNLAVDIVISRSNVHADVGHDELQQRQGPDSSLQAVQSDNKDTGPWRSSEDGYNWRKYGQKHIKGSEFPRSYYKCSHPSCQVKKQVERSHNGCITEVVYKGQHDHPKPQSNNQIVACTIRSIQEEKSNGVSVSNSTEEKSLNGHGQTSPQPKPNGAPELSLVLVSDGNVEGAGEKSIRVRDAVEDDDDPESKRRRLKLNTDIPTKGQQHESLVQPDQCQSQAIASSCSVENMNAAVSSHELALSVTVPNPSVDVFTSGAIVPSAVDCDDRGQKSDSGVHKVPSDHKGTTRFVTAERLWGDGYNWRKYGQKQIKGSEFPRSYYRCTYPNCQVKKQLERSHDGKVTEIIYKGEHDHPKPQPSSHMAVGRILSIQEDGCDRLSSLSCTEDKSSDGHNKLTHHTELGVPELSPTITRDNGVQGEEGSQSNRIDDKVEHDDDLEFNRRRINVNEASIDAAAASNDKQGKVSIEVNGQCQSQILASSPSAKDKTTDVSTHELTPSTPASNPPVYMVTSRGIVPVEVDCDESRQRQVSDSGVQATQSDHNGISIAMTEKLLENAYHWRKYGQKNIKGSEFPRSYYRCTHPNCTVKMQLERSHDGRIIEIIYKGKHDHPKPQPISRMAIGAILSLEEERSDMFSLNSREEEKRSNGHAQTSLDANPNGTSELSPASDDDVEYAGGKLHRTHDEVENDNDAEFKHRKKDAGDVDFTPVVRAPKEPRIVVETLTEFDVVDDGYRWQKYGRKMVKGNPNPRNYYRCSNAACPVKKHVERASHNPKAVITTYEGKHNHDLPPPRTSGMDIVQRFGSSDTVVTRLDDNDTISLDVGIATTSGPENRSNEKQQSMDVEPIQSKATETNTVSAHNGDATDTADHDRSRKDRGESFSFDTPSLKDSSDQGAQNMES